MKQTRGKKNTLRKLIPGLVILVLLVLIINKNQTGSIVSPSNPEIIPLTLELSDSGSMQTESPAGEAYEPSVPQEKNDSDIPENGSHSDKPESESTAFSFSSLPEYSGEPFIVINENNPFFTPEELTVDSFEEYSPLDSLGRCGVCFASVGRDLMSEEARGNISSVHPSGWHSVQYDNVEKNALYNRSHLIGYQLTGENANERNLITGTRYLNAYAMLPFEEMIADYVKETGFHVLYRVTPCFADDELVARGLLMEGESVEDEGEAILFCVYCFNVQPGIIIDYQTGDSQLAPSDPDKPIREYVINTNSRKIHLASCQSAIDMKGKNRQEYRGSYEDLVAQGYTPCPSCHPEP